MGCQWGVRHWEHMGDKMWSQSLAPFAGMVNKRTGTKERAAWHGQAIGTQGLLEERIRDLLCLGEQTDILAGPERFSRSHPGERRRSEGASWGDILCKGPEPGCTGLTLPALGSNQLYPLRRVSWSFAGCFQWLAYQVSKSNLGY